MRKKLTLCLAAALTLIFAVSSMALAGASVSGPSTVDPGETIQVTISGTGEGVNGNVNASGLEFVSCSSQLSAQGAFVLLPDFGTSSVTYTYRVTAQSGSVSVSLSNVMESVDGEPQSASGSTWTASVNAAEQPSQAPSQAPSQEPSEAPSQAPSAQPSGSASAAPSGSVKPGASVRPGTSGGSGTSGTQDRMPKTGDATADLWVLAVIAAGAVCTAAIAGRKVFSR